jgi:hypothetical protein
MTSHPKGTFELTAGPLLCVRSLPNRPISGRKILKIRQLARELTFLDKDGVYDGEPTDSAQAIVDLDQLRAKGAACFVFTSDTLWWLDFYTEFADHFGRTATLVSANSDFRIYHLAEAAKY